MKRFLLVCSMVPAICFAQQEKDFVIRGSLRMLPDGTEIMVKNEEISPEPLAVGKSKGGKFELKGKIAEPNLYYITYPGTKQRLYIFLDPSEMTITGHKDSLNIATVKGSATNNVFVNFNKTFNPYFQQLQPLVQSINGGEPDPGNAKRKQYFDLISKANAEADKFIAENAGSPVASLATYVLMQLSAEITATEKRYKTLSPDVQSSYFGKMTASAIEEAKIGAVGTQAIEFVQNDTTGNPVSLSSFRGKYVLLDFWASWCGPCRHENPNLVSAYEKFKSKNFTVLGVSLDRAREPWLKAIKDDNLAWTQVSDLKFWSNAAATKYKVGEIPQNFLIDPNGVIIARNLRGAQLHQKLSELLQ